MTVLVPGFPRAGDANLLASAPSFVPLIQSSATLISPWQIASLISGTLGNNLPGVGILCRNIQDGNYYVPYMTTNASDNEQASNQLLISAREQLYNGTTGYDRARNNFKETILASAVRNATTQSAVFTNYNARGAIFILYVTAAPGVETLTLRVYNENAPSALTMVSFPASGTGATGYQYVMYPGAVETIAVAQLEVQAIPLPRSFSVNILHSGAGNWTYSVTAVYIL